MNRHLIRLQRHSLSAIAMLFIVALMSPTGAVAAPSCDTHPNHPKLDCENNSGSSASYEIAVYLGEVLLAGMADDVDGSGNESRPKIGNTDMQLNLTEMSLAMMMDEGPGSECLISEDFANNVTMLNGEFAVTTATRPKNSEFFTYITAAFYNFTVSESVYFLVFGPDGDATIGDDLTAEKNWPPAESGEVNSNFMSGTLLELKVVNGPAKKGPCDRLEITLDWKIVVTKE